MLFSISAAEHILILSEENVNLTIVEKII